MEGGGNNDILCNITTLLRQNKINKRRTKIVADAKFGWMSGEGGDVLWWRFLIVTGRGNGGGK